MKSKIMDIGGKVIGSKVARVVKTHMESENLHAQEDLKKHSDEADKVWELAGKCLRSDAGRVKVPRGLGFGD